ncbi:MAG: hypothetical protein IJ218_02285 [Alphaproteobacteria bacterium]|nr:hypothetical protein [Alphaproteobacteria bacterium]
MKKFFFVIVSLFVINVVNANTLFFPPEWGEIKSINVSFSENEVGSDFVYILVCRFDAGGAAPVIVRRNGKVELDANGFTSTIDPYYNSYYFVDGVWCPVTFRRTVDRYNWFNYSLDLHKGISPSKFITDYNLPITYSPERDVTIEKLDGKYLIYLKGNLITVLR